MIGPGRPEAIGRRGIFTIKKHAFGTELRAMKGWLRPGDPREIYEATCGKDCPEAPDQTTSLENPVPLNQYQNQSGQRQSQVEP